MLRNLKITIFILLMVLTSCVKETVDPRMDNTIATSRTARGLMLEIHTTEGNTVIVNATKIALGNASVESFTVVVNPGTVDALSYTAVSVTATSATSHLRIVKNPGLGQVTYLDKDTVTITANSNNSLLMTINPGNIVVTADNTIIEENDGI